MRRARGAADCSPFSLETAASGGEIAPFAATCFSRAARSGIIEGMGINIGLDIGAISLKLAALGTARRPSPARKPLCDERPSFRLLDWDAPGGRRLPLVISDYRRIAGSPIQSTFDLLQEFYETVPEKRIEGIRVTGSGSRTIAKILGIYFENEFKAIARMIGAFYPAGADGLRNRRRELEVHPPGAAAGQRAVRHRRLRPQRRVRGRHRARSSTSRPCG